MKWIKNFTEDTFYCLLFVTEIIRIFEWIVASKSKICVFHLNSQNIDIVIVILRTVE